MTERSLQPHCLTCGWGLRIDNKSGYCSKNVSPGCRPGYRPANRTVKECKNCGKLTRGKTGYCTQSKECIALADSARHASRSHPEVCYLLYSPARNLYKVGHSANLQARLPVVRSKECPDAELVKVWPGGRRLEKKVHHIWEPYRQTGEWFAWPAAKKFSPVEDIRRILLQLPEPVLSVA